MKYLVLALICLMGSVTFAAGSDEVCLDRIRPVLRTLLAAESITEFTSCETGPSAWCDRGIKKSALSSEASVLEITYTVNTGACDPVYQNVYKIEIAEGSCEIRKLEISRSEN